jgi:chromosome segregation ATPase
MCQAVCPRLKSFERDELILQEGRDEMQAEVAEAQTEIIRVKAEADEARARTKMLLLEKDRHIEALEKQIAELRKTTGTTGAVPV